MNRRHPHLTDDESGPRSRLLTVVVTAAAASLALAVGVAAGRATAGADARPAAVGPPVHTASPAMPAPPGSPRVVAGVLEGYAHTRDGARTAATAFLGVEVGDLMAMPDAYRAAWREMCTPSYYASGGRDAAETVIAAQEATNHLVTNAARGQRVYEHVFPLTASVASYDGDSAAVTTWSLLVAHPGDGPTIVSFEAGTVGLRWYAGDWKLGGGQGSSSPLDGTSGPLRLDAGPGLPGYLSDPAGER
jgi:hypothetical protein